MIQTTKLSSAIRLILFVGCLMAPTQAVQAQEDVAAIVNGNWNNAATWTAGGPPGVTQNAYVGSNSPVGAAAVATVTLTTSQSAQDLHLGQSVGNDGTLDLNGNVLTVIRDLTIGRFGGIGTINHGGGHFVTDELYVSGGNAYTFSAADTAANLSVFGGSAISTAATANVSTFVQVRDPGSTLSLGDDLSLTTDLDIRGNTSSTATVDANGNDITARDVFIGRFGAVGAILSDGAITATRNLEVSGGTFTLDANDSVTDTVSATAGGTLTLHANTAAQNASLSGNNATLNTVATSNLSAFVTLNGAGDLLDMGADLILTADLDIRGAAGTPSIVQANGNDITARDIFIGRFGNAGDILNDGAMTATRNLEVSGGTFTLDANDSVTDTVSATSGGTLTLHANTAAMNASLSGNNATLNTVATSNLSAFVTLNGAGDLLDMGADLNLTGDLDIRGAAGTPSIVQANGNNILARDIYIGRFGSAGDILNDGAITATRNLEVSGGTFTLDANDSVADTVSATSGGTLTLHANTTAQNASLSGNNATLNTVATSNLSSFVTLNGAAICWIWEPT